MRTCNFEWFVKVLGARAQIEDTLRRHIGATEVELLAYPSAFSAHERWRRRRRLWTRACGNSLHPHCRRGRALVCLGPALEVELTALVPLLAQLTTRLRLREYSLQQIECQ